MSTTDPLLLSVNNLHVSFADNEVVRALSFTMQRGETLAIVGESGSGKSVTSASIMGLLPFLGGKITQGEILFSPDAHTTHNLVNLEEGKFRDIRGNQIAMIFQEPMSSLNPVFSIGDQLTESLRLHRGLSQQQALAEAARLLDMVRLPDAKAQLKRYPHQLSGGMRQRVMIAMAASCHPQLLIADEPTTALDVTVQAQILQIIRDMQQEMHTSVLFITHDMGVVAEMADDIVVMEKGNLIEKGTAKQILYEPQERYTVELMAAVPRIGAMNGKSLPEKFPLPGVPHDDSFIADGARIDDGPLIELENVSTYYPIRSGFFNRVHHRVYAAEKINFSIYPGETLALVGESGSGKSTVGKTLQQLVRPAAGRILFRGQDILNTTAAQRALFKRQIQYVFQDPYGSLNPRKTIRQSLTEPMRLHGLLHNPKQQISQLLQAVDLPPQFAERYPHEFSGGQRQRICIARALACQPSLIIADEAVSALDVSVQAQVVNLMMDLQKEKGLSYLFISHDMAVVERISHRVAVMYLGQIVEIGTRQQIFENPQHPYTQRLLSAVPSIDGHVGNVGKTPISLTDADIPSPIRAVDDPPPTYQYYQASDGHLVAEH